MYQLEYQENGLATGKLSLSTPFYMKKPAVQPVRVSVISTYEDERLHVENFIKEIYQKAYGAEINIHYPFLMSVRDKENNILAALGFRYAELGPLFLEQYLSSPIDNILNAPRDHIAEIGNLASKGGGASLFLFTALAAYLQAQGQYHAVITGTGIVENRLRLMGIKPKRLAVADPKRLKNQDEDWGSYYETKPNVLCGRIDYGYRRLQQVLCAHYTEINSRLFARIHYPGEPS